MQQGDVLLFQTPDGGDVEVAGGLMTMDGGLRTAAYLSLFGGNEDDDGVPGNRRAWWGNTIGEDPRAAQTSRTQYLLRSIPAVSGNLRRIEDAVRQDLEWLGASSITVAASIPSLNRVMIAVTILANGEESSFEFAENWKAST